MIQVGFLLIDSQFSSEISKLWNYHFYHSGHSTEKLIERSW